MTVHVVVTYANGVFTPKTPVDLPENSTLDGYFKPTSADDANRPPVGSREAMEAFIRRCRESPLHSGAVWNGGDELYDRF
ncbi:MAG: hypothetical protein SH850_28975 [Planctomycetaceae bacterium]|nr:hypothetical protein [Planctomycetaceae bacterium]